MTLDEHISQIINNALRERNYNQSKVAELLKITRGTIHKYMDPNLSRAKLKKEKYLDDQYRIRTKYLEEV